MSESEPEASFPERMQTLFKALDQAEMTESENILGVVKSQNLVSRADIDLSKPVAPEGRYDCPDSIKRGYGPKHHWRWDRARCEMCGMEAHEYVSALEAEVAALKAELGAYKSGKVFGPKQQAEIDALRVRAALADRALAELYFGNNDTVEDWKTDYDTAQKERS